MDTMRKEVQKAWAQDHYLQVVSHNAQREMRDTTD